MNNTIDFKSLGFSNREMYNFPNIINIEVYRGNCPCNCVHCPIGITKPHEREEKFGYKGIEIGLYKTIVKEISHYPHTILRIHSTGEPLLWEELSEALELTRNMSVKSWIFTCGVTDDISKLVSICENASIVEISVNSISAMDYKATKGINAFEHVVENIRYMHNYIMSKCVPTRLIVSRVESSDKTSDDDFVKYWKSIGLVDDAFVRTYHSYNNLMANHCKKNISIKKTPCLVHWARFNISIEGNAVICFNELFKENLSPSMVLGNLYEHTIAEIWHGPKLTALRKAELSNDYPHHLFDDTLPCKNCHFCQPLLGNRQTSEYQIRQWSNADVKDLRGTSRI